MYVRYTHTSVDAHVHTYKEHTRGGNLEVENEVRESIGARVVQKNAHAYTPLRMHVCLGTPE